MSPQADRWIIEVVSPVISELSDVQLVRLRRRAVLLCILTTSVIAAIEIAIGVVFRLISVTAEGLHTAADLADSLVAWVLVAVASRPADRNHPFGHGKYDSLGAIVEGAAVGGAALWATVKAATVLLGLADADPRPEPVTLIAMGSASVIYFFVSRHVLDLAARTHSPTVRAEALHLRSHVYITLGLLVGLAVAALARNQGWPYADRIDALAAVILGTYLLGLAWRIIKPGFLQLMDQALPGEEIDQIAECLREFQSEFVEIHALRTRRSGTDRHVDIHLVVNAEMSVRAAHELAHRIEERLMDTLPGMRLLVHIEPAVGETLSAWLARNRAGMVVVGQESPVEREATHHDSERAHRL